MPRSCDTVTKFVILQISAIIFTANKLVNCNYYIIMYYVNYNYARSSKCYYPVCLKLK